MVDLLEILSHLQKRDNESVIRTIEKNFLEAFSASVFQEVKPIFDLINLIVFNLDDNKFDYNQLIEIFQNFLGKSMKVDMRLTEILMIYLLKDDILTSTSRRDTHDSNSITNLFKRQICNVQSNSNHSKMLVKYLSLATTFYNRETYILRSINSELTEVINSKSKMSKSTAIPPILVEYILQPPLYFRHTPEVSL